MWHNGCHTHTHTLAIAMLMLLRCAALNAQQAGDFMISGFVNDPATATTRCTINWENLFYSSVHLLNVDISVDGVGAVCLNDGDAPNPTVIHPGFTAPPYNIIFDNIALTVQRLEPAFTLSPAPYLPFVVLSFRAQPATQVNVSASGYLIETVGGTHIPIGSANASWTVSQGANFVGDLTKPDGLGCTDLGSSGLYIPGVTVTKIASVPPGVCFPGATFESGLFPFGAYNFDDSPYNEAYVISPSKTGTSVCCGVTSNDQAWMHEAILLPEGKLLWKIMAADFNGSGTFSTYDIVLVRRCILGLPVDMTSDWKPWRFVPWHNNPWPGDNPMRQIDAPEVLTLNDIPSDIKVTPTPLQLGGGATSFWGVKRGDVDGDCQICGLNLTSDPTEARTQTRTEKAFVADRRMEEGQEGLIPVYAATDVLGVNLFGIEILFDNKMLEVLSVENGDLEQEEALHNIVFDQTGTAARYSWLSYEPADIRKNTVLFYVRARAKQTVNSFSGLLWQELGSDVNALFKSGKRERMAFEVGLAPAQSDSFSVELVGANPVSSTIQLDLTLPAELSVKVTIVDSKGFAARTLSRELPSGRSSIVLNDLPQAPGIYGILVQTSAGQRSLRFVKL